MTTNFDELARKEEIFLDLLSFECSQFDATKYLMKDRYIDALTEEEKEIREFVEKMTKEMLRYQKFDISTCFYCSYLFIL